MTAYLIVALIDLIVALTVLRVSRGRTSTAFAVLWSCFAVWTFTLYLQTSIEDVTTLAAWFHPLRLGMLFIAPAMMVYFCLVTRTALTLPLKGVIGLSVVCSTGLYLWNLAVQPSSLVATQAGFTTAPDLISHIHEANFIFASLFSVGITLAAYRHAMFRERRRILWLAAATGTGALFGVMSFGHSKLFGMAGNLIGLAGLSYALLKYHVINVGMAFRTIVVRAATFASLMVLFWGLNSALRYVPVRPSEILAIQIVALFALFEVYPYLARMLGQFADRHLFSEEYNHDYARDRLLKALKNCTSNEAFRQLSDDLFLKLVRVQRYSLHLMPNLSDDDTGALSIYDPANPQGMEPAVSPLRGAFLEMLKAQEETLFYDEAAPAFKADFANLNASAIIPVRSSGEPVGFILLGAPLKPEQFSYDDIRLLNWFGTEVGPVLEAVLSLGRLESSLLEAEKTLSVVSRLNEYNHDIKTPFANIEALLLAGDAFSAEERQARILDQVRRGHALVATMTGLLKGRQRRIQSAVDLNAVIERVVATFPTKAKLVQLDLQPLPPMAGYEDEIELLLSNLLANAFSAQDKARHEVRIWTWFDKTEGRIGCSIQDNGCGMTADRLASLWQGGESTRRAEGGTGVGMTVIRRIVESHDGTIIADSEAGMGTRFTLSLPVQAGDGHGTTAPMKVVSGRP